MAQFTVRVNEGSIKAKFGKLKELYGDTVEEKLTSLGFYAVEVSPVRSGAYVESMSIRPRGSSGGRMRTSDNKPLKDMAAAKADARANITSDVSTFKEQIMESGGAVLVNRSPHNKAVEDKYQVLGRTRDRFR